jgi:alpha-1,2-mannosyltransferase
MLLISLPVILTGLFLSFEKYLNKPWMRWAWWIVSVLVVGIIGWFAGRDLNWFDFTDAYYAAGRAALTDLNQLYSTEISVFGFVNFPLLAYLFVPFGLLSNQIAGQLFYSLGYISIIPLAYWLIKVAELNGWRMWFMLAILTINDPLEYSLDIGNSTHFIMVAILISLWWVKQGKDWLAGILLGFSGLMKLSFIPSLAYFFVRRRWRVVAGGLLIAGLAIVLSLLLIPSSLNMEWLDKAVLSTAGTSIAADNNQSLSGVLARHLISGSDVFSWEALPPEPVFSLVLRISMLLLYLPILIILFIDWKSQLTPNQYIFEFLIVFMCSLLTSPVSWTHYYMFCLIPIAIYIKEFSLEMHKLWLNLLFGCSLALLCIPTSVILRIFEMTDQRIFLSTHFFGGVILYIFLLALWFSQKYGYLRNSPVSN